MKHIFCICALLGFAAPVFAITGTVTGVNVTLEYDEPNVKADGSPLNDLAFTSIYFTTAPASIAFSTASAVVISTVAASALTGNGHITRNLNVPSQAGKEILSRFGATATDTSGNESVFSNIISVLIDKLAPAAPR